MVTLLNRVLKFERSESNRLPSVTTGVPLLALKPVEVGLGDTDASTHQLIIVSGGNRLKRLLRGSREVRRWTLDEVNRRLRGFG